MAKPKGRVIVSSIYICLYIPKLLKDFHERVVNGLVVIQAT